MNTETHPFQRQLNGPQWDAVNSLQGPLLILAGAGSGKTRVLTYRMANLILQGEATPGQILAVTFTNKAAREMEARVRSLLMDLQVPIHEDLWVTTFHSGCARILREHIHLLEYKPFFVIYDDSDQLALIKKVMNTLNINDKIHPAKGFRSRINEAKSLALFPEDIEKRSHHIMDEKSLAVYKLYEQEMKKANALDFGDLLLKTYELFRLYPAVLEEYQQKFRFIMVDEYQDTNHLQYLIVKMLASGHHNICVVGDEDQSIYSWRGADITNILDFEKDFSEARVIKLEENYRSTQVIVEAASHVIKNNSQRKDKTLFTNNPEGSRIHIREETDEYEEARFVVKKIQDLMNTGSYSYEDFAIFIEPTPNREYLKNSCALPHCPTKLLGASSSMIEWKLKM